MFTICGMHHSVSDARCWSAEVVVAEVKPLQGIMRLRMKATESRTDAPKFRSQDEP